MPETTNQQIIAFGISFSNSRVVIMTSLTRNFMSSNLILDHHIDTRINWHMPFKGHPLLHWIVEKVKGTLYPTLVQRKMLYFVFIIIIIMLGCILRFLCY